MCQVGGRLAGTGEWGVVSYEAGVRSDRRAGNSRFGTVEARPAHVIGRAYEPRSGGAGETGGAIFQAAQALLQVILPVLLLVALGAAAFLYGDRPVTWFGTEQAQWLSVGHLVILLTFFAIALTNRRYGAGYAFAQVLMAWLVGGAALWLAAADLPHLAGRVLPALPTVVGFGTGLFFAQLFSVIVFDRTRGPRWWTAPFQAFLWGGLLLCLIAFPLTYMGTAVDWMHRLAIYAEIIVASSLLLLVPYWILRPVFPPQSGFGGY